MTKTVCKQKAFSWSISPIFCGEKIFSEISSPVTHNLIIVLRTITKLKRISNSKKHLDRQKEGQKDWQAIFYRTHPATAGCPISTTEIDSHLKVKDTEYNVDLTKIYYIASSMQSINLIHKQILTVQQILGSHELHSCTHFWPWPTKFIKINLKIMGKNIWGRLSLFC